MLRRCKCLSLPLRLLQLGLFPCTPFEPRLAVDLQMLEFVKGLFLRLPPNMTAWCDTLECFLEERNYSLETRVSEGRCLLCDVWLIRIKDTLRKRFGHAMHWYGVLVNEKNRTVRRAVDIHRPIGETDEVVEKGTERGGLELESDPRNSLGLSRVDRTTPSPATSYADLPPSSPASLEVFFQLSSPISSPSNFYRSSSSPQSSYAALQASSTNHFASTSRSSSSFFRDVSDSESQPPPLVEDDESDDDEASAPPRLPIRRERRAREKRPTEYLRRRCPICFGGGRGRSRYVLRTWCRLCRAQSELLQVALSCMCRCVLHSKAS